MVVATFKRNNSVFDAICDMNLEKTSFNQMEAQFEGEIAQLIFSMKWKCYDVSDRLWKSELKNIFMSFFKEFISPRVQFKRTSTICWAALTLCCRIQQKPNSIQYIYDSPKTETETHRQQNCVLPVSIGIVVVSFLKISLFFTLSQMQFYAFSNGVASSMWYVAYSMAEKKITKLPQ